MRTTKSKTTSSSKRAKTSTPATTGRARRLIEEEEPLTDVTDSQSDMLKVLQMFRIFIW